MERFLASLFAKQEQQQQQQQQQQFQGAAFAHPPAPLVRPPAAPPVQPPQQQQQILFQQAARVQPPDATLQVPQQFPQLQQLQHDQLLALQEALSNQLRHGGQQQQQQQQQRSEATVGSSLTGSFVETAPTQLQQNAVGLRQSLEQQSHTQKQQLDLILELLLTTTTNPFSAPTGGSTSTGQAAAAFPQIEAQPQVPAPAAVQAPVQPQQSNQDVLNCLLLQAMTNNNSNNNTGGGQDQLAQLLQLFQMATHGGQLQQPPSGTTNLPSIPVAALPAPTPPQNPRPVLNTQVMTQQVQVQQPQQQQDKNKPVSVASSSNGTSSKSSRQSCTDYPMDGVTNPGQHDVLLGRGSGASNHLGNISYRMLINQHKTRYMSASRVDKPKVADEIVHIWRNLNPPGRFLTRCDSDDLDEDDDYTAGRWRDVGNAKAKTKTCQCLREKDRPSKARRTDDKGK